MARITSMPQAKRSKSLPAKSPTKRLSKPKPATSTTRKRVPPQKITAKKVSAKKTAFPSRPSKFPSTMSESQKHRASGRSSHRERVLMRAMLRKSGTIARDAPNDVGDKWLQSHGYLHGKGYQPPTNRVSKLSKAVGFKRRPTPRQLGIT